MGPSQFLKWLNVFGVTKDSSGNINAQIVPRYDTLADLLAVSNAGDGEIAHASDTDALVVYKGSPTSVGRVYRRGDLVGEVNAALSFASIANGGIASFSTLGINVSSLYDPGNLVSGGIIVPDIQVSGDICLVEINLLLSIVGHTVGTNLYGKIQRQKISDDSWEDFTAHGTLTTTQNSLADYMVFTQVLKINPATHDHLRVQVSHDDSAARFCTGYLNVKFRQMEP